jgi:hypothetical protein
LNIGQLGVIVMVEDDSSAFAPVGQEYVVAFEPVGEFYHHAISSDESCTSANELTDTRFEKLFECAPVNSLGELLSPGIVAPNAPTVSPAGWVAGVRAALLDTTSSEEHMNGVLQRALRKVGLDGLKVEVKEKQKQPLKKRLRNFLEGLRQWSPPKRGEEDNRLFKVIKRQIRKLFVDCYGGEECYKDLERLNGLPISLESRPDFAAWVGGGMLMTCEGRHRDNFELSDAIRQCSAYMLVHLYYLLVTKCRLVQSVYGVAVAGTECKDMKGGANFAVVLLRLSLPTKIGGLLLLQQYKITSQEGDSLEDLCVKTA